MMHETTKPEPELAEAGAGESRVFWGVLLAAVFVIAAALRLYQIHTWPLRGDEFSSIYDAQNMWTFEPYAPRRYPAFYFLLWGWLKATGYSDAVWGVPPLIARLPTVLFALITFPLFWVFGKRVFGRRITAVALALVAVTEWHIYLSTYTRYFSALFLLTGLAGMLLYEAVWRTRPWRALAASLLGLLAVAFHPSAAFAILGFVCYLVLLAVFRRLRPAAGFWKMAGLFCLPLLLVSIPGVWLMYRTLRGWAFKGLLWNYTPTHTVLGIARHLGFTVSLAAAGGALVCAFKRSRLAVFLVCWVVPGVIALIALSPFVDVRPDYVFSVMPACFFLAAALCVVPFVDQEPTRARAACITALALMVVLSQVPPMLSHFTQRRVDDPRIAAAFLKKAMLPDDEFIVYMTGVESNLGRETYRLGQLYSQSATWEEGLEKVRTADQRTWFVVSYPRAGVPDALDDWLCRHARLVERWRAKRFDYITRDVEIWLYDPRWAPRPIELPKGPSKQAPAGGG
jgi:hypothetical protein